MERISKPVAESNRKPVQKPIEAQYKHSEQSFDNLLSIPFSNEENVPYQISEIINQVEEYFYSLYESLYYNYR